MTALLAVRDLTIRVGRRTLCNAIDLTVQPGQCWALLGRNGVGKSTLLHHLCGLLTAKQGAVQLAGERLQDLSARARARRVGLLLQHSSRGFGGTVFDTVMSGRHPHLGPLQREGARDREVVWSALEDLDLEQLARRTLTHLSGGELRRVELARLLAQQAPLNLLDEPLNHLDPAHQARSLSRVKQRCVGAERAAVIVAHDLNLAYQACDQWLILEPDGRWRSGPREDLADPTGLSDAFGHTIDRLTLGDRVTFATRFIESSPD